MRKTIGVDLTFVCGVFLRVVFFFFRRKKDTHPKGKKKKKKVWFTNLTSSLPLKPNVMRAQAIAGCSLA